MELMQNHNKKRPNAVNRKIPFGRTPFMLAQSSLERTNYLGGGHRLIRSLIPVYARKVRPDGLSQFAVTIEFIRRF
jgi:hypothetical protein